jgi:hypothetical protein
VQVVFHVISGPNVNAGVATIGSDIFTLDIDEENPVANNAQPVPVNLNSFAMNGELYTIFPGPTAPTTAPAK